MEANDRLFISIVIALKLTLHIDSASTGQHHHVGGRAGWLRRFHCCSYGATCRCSAGGGACSACVGITYNHCWGEKNHSVCRTNVYVICFSQLQSGVGLPSLFPVSAGNRREAF